MSQRYEFTFTYLHEDGSYITTQLITAKSFDEAYKEFRIRQPNNDVMEVSRKII